MTKENADETVTMSSSFFEKLFGGLISKADPEPPEKPQEKEENKEEEKEDDKFDEIIKRLDSFDERINKLENPEEAPGAVSKSESAATGQTAKDKFKLYDPAKLHKVCTAVEIIKATDGRSINFYGVLLHK